MFKAEFTPIMATATLILVAGLVDDLRSRKFHNWLFLICCGAGIVTAFATGGLTAFLSGLGGFGMAVAVMLPLVLTKGIGAGDLKLLAAFGLAANWNTVLYVAFFSLFWGAIFGVVRVVIAGQGAAFARNIFSIVTTRTASGLELHKIPYSVALFVGWLTFLTYQGVA